MLEGLAAWVLNTYVGEYVENLNTDQLSIGLLTGAVELENLPLRKDALKNLDLPIEVKAGFIGKIRLQIPVRHLKSEPWVISVENLYLVAGPASKTKYDPQNEDKHIQDRKLQQLGALEVQWKGKMQVATPEAGSSSWYAYSTSLLYNVLENLQLKVKDVHIRYEDSTTIPNESFAFGITIKSLSAQSTNEDWEPKIVQGQEGGMKFKLLEIENFAMYWDTDVEPYGDLDMTDLREALQRDMARSKSSNEFKEHEYLLKPVSADAKLKRNGSQLPLRSRSTPRFICDIQLDKIPLSLSEDQYKGLVSLAREFERSDKAKLYRKWRPDCPVKGNCKEWWKFAITSTLNTIQERHRKKSAEFFSKRVALIKQYVTAYTNCLLEEQGTPQSVSKVELEQVEKELSFEELRILRQVVYGQLEKRMQDGEEIFKKPEVDPSQQGVMQRWVWGWGSWYYGSASSTEEFTGVETDVDSIGSSPKSLSPPPIDEQEQQELMDVIGDPIADSTLLKRDHVFALLNFNLKGGSFQLCSSYTSSATSPMSPTNPNAARTLVELEFAEVNMSLESRLRTSSMLFTAKLGALYIRDVMTKGSLFPVLVSPQQKREEAASQQQQQQRGSNLSLLSRTGPGSYMAQTAAFQRQASTKEQALFEMTYESNPPNYNADCRLQITTRPMDMVYNPTAIQRISDFFNSYTKGGRGLSSRGSELQLTRAAKLRYEELKNQTKQELRQTLDDLLEGEHAEGKRWAIDLDISAPQIIIPDSFHSKEATLVVLDFGHLQLSSATAKSNKAKKEEQKEAGYNDDEDDDGDLDDDFATPLSTPPNERVEGSTSSMTSSTQPPDLSSIDTVDFGSAVTETALRERMYDRYQLDMSELQVLVGKATDNWRMAHTKGSCHMQVIEKFTISVQLERRLTFTTDPQWPSATVAGNLPSLSIHINEKKIQALNTCLKLLLGPDDGPSAAPPKIDDVLKIDRTISRAHTTSISEFEATFTQRTRALLEESKLLEMQFSVGQVSLEVQSRGRCIAECQVYGVNGNLCKRPYDASISLTVHGLLLIDALQQFGQDFELLLASHRDLSMHVPSGSIIDSDTSTPRSIQSPVSPQSPASPAEKMMESTSQPDFSSAISSMGKSTSGMTLEHLSSLKYQVPVLAEDAEALITVDLDLLSANCPSNTNGDEAMQIATIQFNSLDVIANQETIIELLAFFKNAFPEEEKSKDKKEKPKKQMSSLSGVTGEPSLLEMETSSGTKTEVTANFRCLNLVLVRGVKDFKQTVGRKVATVTLSDAHVWGTLDDNLHVEGSLGGLQLLDLTPNNKHQKIFSVGQDPTMKADLPSRTGMPLKLGENETVDLYRTAIEIPSSGQIEMTDGEEEEENKALTFTLSKGDRVNATLSSMRPADFSISGRSESRVNSVNVTDLDLHLASLCYTHVPRFLNELTMSVDEFHSTAEALADSLQKAATEVALEFVRQKSEYVVAAASPSMFGNLNDGDFAAMDSTLEDTADGTSLRADVRGKQSVFKFKMAMETPIIVLPRMESSSEVLVAHLGKILITNSKTREDSDATLEGESSSSNNRLYLSMRDMNMFSFNQLDSKTRSGSSSSHAGFDPSRRLSYKGTPILHNTSLELTIDQIPPEPPTMVSDYSSDTLGTEDSINTLEEASAVIEVCGRIVSPLKVILSKHVFEQVIQTVDNLTYDKGANLNINSAATTPLPDSGNFDSMFEPTTPQDIPSVPTPTSSQASIEGNSDPPTHIKAKFDLPEFSVQLQGDLSDGEQGLVDISFKNFSVNFEKKNPYTTSIDVTLQSVVMEDLLQEASSKHRYLIVSRETSHDILLPKTFLSTSLPSIASLPSPIPYRPSSLPASLDNSPGHQYNSYQPGFRTSSSMSTGRSKTSPKENIYPSTPPPSIDASMENIVEDSTGIKDDALVRIRVMLVDKKCPYFEKKYKKVNRFVEVDFNALDTTLNVQTWVVLLDFLGIGGAKPKPDKSADKVHTTESSQRVKEDDEEANMEMQIQLKSLSLILNKPEYELAKAQVSDITAHLLLMDGNIDLSGRLGNMSLLDLTPHGNLYRERFTTKGEEALSFKIFKYGQPDPGLWREFDLSVRLRMSSVRYVHTNRFQSEVVAFAQHFNQLQDVLSRMRAASAGQQIQEGPNRSSRISLNIEAGSPVILAPVSSKSKNLLVINLGNLTLKNQFLFAGEEGTIAKMPSKVDRGDSFGDGNVRFSTGEEEERKGAREKSPTMGYTVKESKIGTLAPGKVVSPSSPPGTPDSAYLTSQSTSSLDETKDPLRRRCLLDCMYVDLNDMDLYSAERIKHDDFQATDVTALIFPSFVISRKQGGRLLKETCILKLQVERNLDADISRAVPDICITGKLSSVHCSLDTPQYQLIRGMLDHNFGEQIEEFQAGQLKQQSPMTQTVLSGQVWTNISLNIDLVNVTVELLNSQQQDTSPEQSLGQFDFIQSNLAIETFSDGSKTIDLTSHAIRASDTRWKESALRTPGNVFWEVLTPTRHHSRNPNPLQMEIHYSSTPGHTKATILLNNMRVICVMDLILAVKDFLLDYDAKMVHGADSRKRHASGGSSASSSKPPSSRSSATYVPEGRAGTPVSVGSGIVTKRAAPPQQDDKTLEMRVNITETEFVVLENTEAADTNAVILKASCAVLTYKPERRDNPLTCNLQELEVFSCCMGPNEADTALSIIDPVAVTMEVKANPTHMLHGRTTAGLLDVMDVHRSLEIHIQALNVRVSYNDAMLFLAIVNSLPAQILPKDADADEEEEMEVVEQKMARKGKDANSEKYKKRQVSKLRELGFSKQDCEKALKESRYQLDQAASWLLENAQPVATSLSPKHKQHEEDESGGTFEIAGVEVRAGSVSVCLIDDCRDSDVPLIEISLQSMHFFQKLLPNQQGSAAFTLMADYYNRKLSGWEPFLEPWKCNLEWFNQEHSQLYPEKLFIQMKVNDRLDLNVTSALMALYANTKAAWTEDYGNKDEVDGSARRRSPFVPYAIRNHTGCTLWFATLTSTPNRLSTPHDPGSPERNAGTWVEVLPGEEMQFIFEEKGKHRHRNTHELRVHQLLVRVEGWEQVAPVSVDKVGVYFRLAKPQIHQVSTIFSVQHSARVVFEVTLEGTARKVVTVRSGLRLVSRVSIPMELKLVNAETHTDAPIILPMLEPNCSCSIPLPHTNWQVYVRPHGWGVGFCQRPIPWQMVERPKAMAAEPMECKAQASYDEGIFRFVAYIKHEAYPPESAITQHHSTRSRPSPMQPGHTITLLPPMVLTNLLPYELSYQVKKTNMQGTIMPGKDEPLYAADLNHAMDIRFSTENYADCPMSLSIPPKLMTDGYGGIVLRDSHPKKRHLLLKARVECRAERSLKILISAPYWLINKSGLPLIFRQDGADYEAAGQFDEHERARSVAPLMFSYIDSEKPEMCIMRLGKGGAQGNPYWCNKISLEGGTGMRTLRVGQQGGRPQMVYHIGIDIRQGRGRYCDTKIVTFVPRFQLENRSSCKLAFAQRHLVQGLGSQNPAEYLTVMPGSSVIFHWPRDDLDRLLCTRMAEDNRCRWSGGIRIDKPGSLNINMRSSNQQSNIMHVEVSLRGATFFVVFNDYNDIPPPYRIDNLSEVDVIFYQSKVADMSLRTVVRAKTSCPYSWDEPILPPQLTVGVKGGSSGTYSMDRLEEGEKLYYENFIYIAMTHTFASDSQQSGIPGSPAFQGQESYKREQLVFDIDSYRKEKLVVLRPKEPGRRSQLWRMTSTGMLQNEAFIPPRDPRKMPAETSDMLVLDISELTANPQRHIALTLRKADERRTTTQTWFFDVDGRLHCHIGGLVVQARHGIKGLRSGGEVVLGPTELTLQNKVPVEQAIERQKNLPGSGSLVCKVVADGPTRVLQIMDIWTNQQPASQKSVPGSSSGHRDEWILVSKDRRTAENVAIKRPRVSSLSDAVDEKNAKKDIEMVIWVRDGVGLSLVNDCLEELMYITLTGIDVHYLESSGEINLNAGIKNIQVDNQLQSALKPVTLFASKEDEKSHALSLAVTKLQTTTNTVDIYKRLIVTFCKMTLTMEELLLLKLFQFVGMAQEESDVEKMDENHYETLRSTSTETQAKRYFIDTLKLNATEFKLSVLTSPKLPPELQRLKKYQGLFLVQFEDAPVSLDPYTRLHAFETQQFLVDSIGKHYTEELKSQALKLLGSMDFLGNPIGLMQDIQDGLKELIMEGNVSGLAKNVTHGLSNTAAKVTSTLSDGLGTVAMDSRHRDVRHAIKSAHDGSSTGHLKAGVRGFAFGVVGGLTSVFQQTYRGVAEDGIVEGLIPGMAKGLIGTVTKPTAGFLDLASGTMAALRSSTSSASHIMPPKARPPRCCANPAGMLPRYSRFDAKGLEYVQKLCEGGKDERYFAMDTLRSNPSDGMQVLITSECTYFLAMSDSLDPVLKVTHLELYHARHLPERGRYYIEVTKKASTELGIQSQNGTATKERPKVRCDNERIAKKVSQQINYAKSCFEELKQQVIVDNQDENLRLELPGPSYTT